MKLYFFNALPQPEAKRPVLLRLAFFCALLYCQTAWGQVCDKKTSVYFETDHYSITAAEDQKLGKLISVFAQKTDTFMLEIYAFTDSVASVDYNHTLANNRLKTIVAYLKKHAHCHFEIKEKVRGEAQPLVSNATEEGRSKNRRVDIFYWKLKDGRITLKGKGGMEIDVPKDQFAPCGVCETNPKITEIFSNEEAERRGMPMTTTDGDELITGGMMGLDFSCNGSVPPCRDVIIRIPAASLDEDFELWQSTGEKNQGAMRWSRDNRGEMDYDAKNKCYVLKVNYCAGKSLKNVDKRKPRVVKDPTGLIAAPELIRSKKQSRTRVMAGTGGSLAYGERPLTNIIWTFYYRGKGSLFFADSGVGTNKIGYVFSGLIDRYEAQCDSARCRIDKHCWCFEIPIDAYTKQIYFQKNKNYRLKIPLKYRKYGVRLFIPAADSTLQVNRVEGSKRKYTFQLPLPDTYVVLYGETADPNNKRAYDAQVDLSEVHVKYKSRKKYYKAKLKRKQIRKAITGS